MTFLRLSSLALAFVFAMMLAACQSGPVETQRTGEETSLAQQVTFGDYALGTGDQLRVTVFGHEDLSGEFEIDGAGRISMPLIGQVDAMNLTTNELENRIVERLDGDYILNPRVSAEVINYRPYYILGEVSRPGEFQYTSGITVLNAVAAAGGFTYRANRKVVYIKSVDAMDEVAYELTTTTIVKPGDTIRIGERIF